MNLIKIKLKKRKKLTEILIRIKLLKGQKFIKNLIKIKLLKGQKHCEMHNFIHIRSVIIPI